jgi:hypothetical protein
MVCVVLLGGASLTDCYAGTSNEIVTKRIDSKSAPIDQKDTVAIASTVSGSLNGQFRAGKYQVRVTDRTKVYQTGRGMIDTGAFLSNAPVYIIGVARNGVVHARLVIVSDSKKAERGGPVRVIGPDEPR